MFLLDSAWPVRFVIPLLAFGADHLRRERCETASARHLLAARLRVLLPPLLLAASAAAAGRLPTSTACSARLQQPLATFSVSF